MRLSTLALFALLAAFGAGIVAVFAVRFNRGDVYPPMSSFRTDPLGSRLLYDSLGSLPGRPVERNLSANPQVGNAAILFLGSGPFGLSEDYKQVNELTALGARVIYTLTSVTRSRTLTPARLKWGLTIDFGPVSAIVDAGSTARETIVFFRYLDPQWKTLKQGRWGPVVIERSLNKGSLVLSAESFPFTNEGLAGSRDPELISSVVGSSPRIVFDEFHLGVRENPGVALLMRKFRLHALLAALAVTAFLFVWSASTPFPPVPEAAAADEAQGFAARSGMVRLLQRSIPPSRLIAVCVGEWSKSVHGTDPGVLRVRELAAGASATDTTGAYKEIQSILEQK